MIATGCVQTRDFRNSGVVFLESELMNGSVVSNGDDLRNFKHGIFCEFLWKTSSRPVCFIKPLVHTHYHSYLKCKISIVQLNIQIGQTFIDFGTK